MKSNYKQLGNYIRQVDVRNRDGKEDNLLGVSNQKKFIPSIANTVGTDFTKYKVVKKNQFSYIPVTSRSGDKVGIALLEDHEEGLVSSFYTVFEVIDRKKLLPQYLMLWFKRAEFDRYARFKSHGSVREVFDWEEMCKVELPVPSYEEQLKIVESYKVITDRIELKKRINDNLASMAMDIYKSAFFDKEANAKLSDLIKENAKSNIAVNDVKEENHGIIPYFTSGSNILFTFNSLVDGRNIFMNDGGTADVKFHIGPASYSSHTWCITGKEGYEDYLYLLLLSIKKEIDIKYFKGSTLKNLQKTLLRNRPIYAPTTEELDDFNDKVKPLFDKISNNFNENQQLIRLKDWLLPILMNRQKIVK